MTSPTIHETVLELPFPPPPHDELVAIMRESLYFAIPPGQKLSRLISQRNIGPDLGADFQPCWRMSVQYETTEVEPTTWNGDNA